MGNGKWEIDSEMRNWQIINWEMGNGKYEFGN